MNERTNTTVNQATYTRVYNLKVKLYTYQGKDGKERGHYVEIGGVMRDESDQHLFMYVEPHITLAGLPRSGKRDKVAVCMFSPDENRNGNGNSNKNAEGNGNGINTNASNDAQINEIINNWNNGEKEPDPQDMPF